MGGIVQSSSFDVSVVSLEISVSELPAEELSSVFTLLHDATDKSMTDARAEATIRLTPFFILTSVLEIW
jgi:hypothetical protein